MNKYIKKDIYINFAFAGINNEHRIYIKYQKIIIKGKLLRLYNN